MMVNAMMSKGWNMPAAECACVQECNVMRIVQLYLRADSTLPYALMQDYVMRAYAVIFTQPLGDCIRLS